MISMSTRTQDRSRRDGKVNAQAGLTSEGEYFESAGYVLLRPGALGGLSSFCVSLSLARSSLLHCTLVSGCRRRRTRCSTRAPATSTRDDSANTNTRKRTKKSGAAEKKAAWLVALAPWFIRLNGERGLRVGEATARHYFR